MLTLDDARKINEFYIASPHTRRIVRVRATGAVRVWKRCGGWRLPLKFGMYESSSVGTHETAALGPDCAFTSVADAIAANPTYTVQNGLV